MDGMTLAKAVEEELKRQGISKGDFYKALGISATAMYGWKRGAEPICERVASWVVFWVVLICEKSHYFVLM